MVTKRLQVRPPTSNSDANDLALLLLLPSTVSLSRSLFLSPDFVPLVSFHTHATTHTSRFFGIRETSSRAVIFGVIAANRDLDLLHALAHPS